MREAVRSGRRANFFITENGFIDHYAAKVGGNGVAVYSILQRCANSETRETWISAGKMAEVLDIDKSTVYRKLKELEDLRLVRSLRTREKTIYVVLPVPALRPQTGQTPLFDALDDKSQDPESHWPVARTQTSSTDATNSYSSDASVVPAQQEFAGVQQVVAPVQSSGRANEKRNKEEQDALNKTQEQEFFNKNDESVPTAVLETAQRILNVLRLPNTSINAAVAAVQLKAKQTKLSPDDLVPEICTAANYAERRGTDRKDFLDDFLALTVAQQVLKNLGLPDTYNMINTVKAAIKAEVAFTGGSSVEAVAKLITEAAIEDSRRGTAIDRFYFENVKWRANVRVTKAEQRTLDNLEVNARVKQRLRERFGASGMDQR